MWGQRRGGAEKAIEAEENATDDAEVANSSIK
jgi:hypothetical protein